MTEPSRTRVHGPVVNDRTGCIHYASELDIVAIRFFCCDRYYPCLHCHGKCADHAIVPWPADWQAEHAVLCGACRTELRICDYLDVDACPNCGSQFNPGCSRHAHHYFELGEPG